jgi:hypothetical protein
MLTWKINSPIYMRGVVKDKPMFDVTRKRSGWELCALSAYRKARNQPSLQEKVLLNSSVEAKLYARQLLAYLDIGVSAIEPIPVETIASAEEAYIFCSQHRVLGPWEHDSENSRRKTPYGHTWVNVHRGSVGLSPKYSHFVYFPPRHTHVAQMQNVFDALDWVDIQLEQEGFILCIGGTLPETLVQRKM